MKLITSEMAVKLGANALIDEASRKPLLKLFTPWGAATWLISEKQGDLMFGLCDLGMGEPELGYVSLSEIEAITGPFGLRVERDAWFEPTQTLAAYADEARAEGRIAA